MRTGTFQFVKVNAVWWDWRDTYHWLLALSWPRFAGIILGIYFALNLAFACLYHLSGACIAEMPAGSFSDAFFFSVETLATVGYGHMYPATLYGHVVTTIEIMVGMFGMAVITGLIFVRFSRPTARLLFSRTVVVSPFNGQPALMLRVANLRHQAMAEAEFRMMFTRDEEVLEGGTMRRFYPLPLQVDRMIIFPVALTIRHIIDKQSPLYELTSEALQRCDARLLASVVCVDTVMSAPVHSQKDYQWCDVHFGQRFVEIYTDLPGGGLSVDYGRLHDTEPA